MSNKIKATAWGLAIIALGVIFGGNALGLFSIDIFFDGWWTLFIIVPSVISLFTDKEKISNLVVLAIGVILLLASQGVFAWGIVWKVILAVVFIGIGLGIVVHNLFRGKNDKEVEKKIHDLEDEKMMDSQMAVFSGTDRVYKDEIFSGANSTKTLLLKHLLCLAELILRFQKMFKLKLNLALSLAAFLTIEKAILAKENIQSI